MGNISALVLLCVSFFLPLLSPNVRANRTLYLICLAALGLHHLASIWNAFVTPLSTTWGDLYRFHNIGAGLDPETGQPYGEFLKLCYRLLGTSFWLGETLSNCVFALSLPMFVELGCLLGARNHLAPCLLGYGFLPSTVIHFAVTMREVYQSTGLLGACLALVTLRAAPRWWAWPLLGISLITLIFMHMGLAVVALLLIVYGVPWALQGRGAFGGLIAVMLLVLSPLYVPKLIDAISEQSSAIRAYENGNLFAYAAKYREGVAHARSDYGVKIQTDSLDTFVTSVGLVVFMYFFAPLPWQVSSTIDYYAFFEVVLRTLLVFGCVQRILQSEKEERARNLFLFLLAIGVEALWAIGTSNWGTSIRHHAVSYTLLLLVGLPYFPNPFVSRGQSLLDDKRRRRRRGRLEETSTSANPLDLLKVHRVLKENGRRALGATLTTALLIVYFTWPSKPQPISFGPVYTSSASLLLSEGKSLDFAGTRSSRAALSDLAFWLSEVQLFENMLSRERVYEKIEEKLRKERPRLAPLYRSVYFTPGYGSFEQKTDLYHSNNEVVDYAQLDIEESENFRARRATRLMLTAAATSAEDSQFLCKASLIVMQKTLEEVATRRVRAQKKVIERYIQFGTRRVIRAEQKLRSLPEASQEELGQLELRRSQILSESRALEAETRELRLHIDHLQRQAGLQAEPEKSIVSEAIHDLRTQKLVAERIYQPDSQVLTELRSRLEKSQALSARLLAERQEREIAGLRSTLTAKENLLRLDHSELSRLERARPDKEKQTDFQKKEKELRSWQEELLNWQQKLLATRIEEKLAEGDGTAVVLCAPLPGKRTEQALATFWETYRKPITMTPLAGLAGLVLLVIAFLAKQTRSPSERTASIFDAPVICEFAAYPADRHGKDRDPLDLS